MYDFKLERKPIHPGEILKHEYLDEMALPNNNYPEI